jgi:hypothetical protein
MVGWRGAIVVLPVFASCVSQWPAFDAHWFTMGLNGSGMMQWVGHQAGPLASRRQ